MAGCGYVCSLCEGQGFDTETLMPCSFCQPNSTLPSTKTPFIDNKLVLSTTPTDNDWMQIVHNQCGCGDL